MFSCFRKPKVATEPSAAAEKLQKTSVMLKEKEKVLTEKASQEAEKAMEFNRGKNKKAAYQCLNTKRLYEQQLEQLGNSQLQIANQMILLEGAEAATETVDALRTGAAAMKAMQEETNIYDVMGEVDEQNEGMRQMLQAISAPSGADFDEEELEAELKELEGAATGSAAPVDDMPVLLLPPPGPLGIDKEDEIADLQAGMAS